MKKRIVILLLLALVGTAWAADVKISELPVVTSVTPATDVTIVNATGVTSQVTVTNLIKGANAGTATALAANGGNCSAGQAPLGVDASGAVESCFAVQASDAELTAVAGLTFADASIIQLTGAAAAATLTSGGNHYFLKSTSDNSALEFATPANSLTAIGGQASSATLTSLAGLTETNGGIPYGTGDNAYAWLAAGAAGKLLAGAGASAPVWTTPTYPTASGTARKMLVSDGTNNVYSTETWAIPGTASNLLISDGTNWTSAANPSILKSVIVAAGDVVVGTGSATPGVITKGANNTIFGVNNSGTLGFNANWQQDDSAAQFYSATASKGTLKFLQTGITDAKVVTNKHTADQSVTFETDFTALSADSKTVKLTFGCTDDCVITTPAATGTLAVTTHTAQYAATPVVDDADNFDDNFTGDNLYGGTFIVNAAGTAVLPEPAVGMNFTIVLEAAAATVIDPLGTGTADAIVMNGLDAADDENITSSTRGAMCVFQYRSANHWMATCNGFAEATPP